MYLFLLATLPKHSNAQNSILLMLLKVHGKSAQKGWWLLCLIMQPCTAQTISLLHLNDFLMEWKVSAYSRTWAFWMNAGSGVHFSEKRVQFNQHLRNNILVIQGGAILVLFSSQSEHCTCFVTHPTIIAWCENSNSFDLFSKRGLHALIWQSTVGCLRCGHRRAYEKKQHSCEIRVQRNLKETTSHVQNKKNIWPCSCQEWGMQWGNKTKWLNEFSIFNMSS